VKRAASEFALVAMAGELAIEYGIVPWPKGDAIKAAAEMFDAKTAGEIVPAGLNLGSNGSAWFSRSTT